jgi:hypothetical protein
MKFEKPLTFSSSKRSKLTVVVSFLVFHSVSTNGATVGWIFSLCDGSALIPQSFSTKHILHVQTLTGEMFSNYITLRTQLRVTKIDLFTKRASAKVRRPHRGLEIRFHQAENEPATYDSRRCDREIFWDLKPGNLYRLSATILIGTTNLTETVINITDVIVYAVKALIIEGNGHKDDQVQLERRGAYQKK